MAVSGEGGISPWLLMLLICIALLIVACVLVLIWLQVRAGRRRAQEEEEEAELQAERDRLRRREEAMREQNLGGGPNLGGENAEYPGNAYRDGASNFGAYGADDDPYGFRDEIRRAATEYSRVQDPVRAPNPVRAPDPVRTPRRPARMQEPLDDEDIATVYKPGPRQSAADDDAPTVYRDGRRSGEPRGVSPARGATIDGRAGRTCGAAGARSAFLRVDALAGSADSPRRGRSPWRLSVLSPKGENKPAGTLGQRSWRRAKPKGPRQRA